MPKPGDFMVTATGGWVAWAIRKITNSKVNHAAVYVDHGGLVVEAQPGGARLTKASKYKKAIWSNFNLNGDTRFHIVTNALSFVNTPYNFLDIAAQALVRVFDWHAPKWALKRLSSSKRLQCAQLVDLAYERAGVTLFKDGRPEGMVSPGDLYKLITEN